MSLLLCSLAKICCSENVSQFCPHGLGTVTNNLLGRGSSVLMGFVRGATREWWGFLLNLGVWKVLLLLHGGLPGSWGFFFCTYCKNSGMDKAEEQKQLEAQRAVTAVLLWDRWGFGGVCSSSEYWDTGVLFPPSLNIAESRSVFTLVLVPCISDLQCPVHHLSLTPGLHKIHTMRYRNEQLNT